MATHRGAELSIRGKDHAAHRSACPAGGAHHWRIETPHDGLRVLPATCRKCGGEREYQATTDEWSAWSDFNVGRPSDMYLEGLIA